LKKQTKQRQIRVAAEAEVDKHAAMPPRRLKGVHRGQNKNKRNYITAFKQLAALRLLEHFQWNYLECCHETMVEPKMKPLYFAGNNTRWFEAADNAAARLVRFNIMWSLEAEPAYFFKFGEFHEVLKWHPKLQADLVLIRSREQLKERMKTLFCGYKKRQELCASVATLNGGAI
jgi:hypothetical protein